MPPEYGVGREDDAGPYNQATVLQGALQQLDPMHEEYPDTYTMHGDLPIPPTALPAPRTLLSPIAWSQREPPEWQEQEFRCARRAAKMFCGSLFRDILQYKFGVKLYTTVQPWPPYLPLPDQGPQPKSVPRKMYEQSPFLLPAASTPSATRARDPFVPPRALVKKKREVAASLHEFGRHIHGAPFSLQKMYADSELRCQLKPTGPGRGKQSGSLKPIDFNSTSQTSMASSSRMGSSRGAPFSFLSTQGSSSGFGMAAAKAAKRSKSLSALAIMDT